MQIQVVEIKISHQTSAEHGTVSWFGKSPGSSSAENR